MFRAFKCRKKKKGKKFLHKLVDKANLWAKLCVWKTLGNVSSCTYWSGLLSTLESEGSREGIVAQSGYLEDVFY